MKFEGSWEKVSSFVGKYLPIFVCALFFAFVIYIGANDTAGRRLLYSYSVSGGSGEIRAATLPEEKTGKTALPEEDAQSRDMTEPSTSDTAQTQKYFVTETGKKYHLSESCGYLKSKNYSCVTYEEILAKGLDLCSACAAKEKNK